MKPGDIVYIRARYEGTDTLPWDQRASVAITLLGKPADGEDPEELMASWVHPDAVVTQADLAVAARAILQKAQEAKRGR